MEVTSHVVEGDTAPQLRIFTAGQPNEGGDYPEYVIAGQLAPNASSTLCEIKFQNGPIPVNGVNGVTTEALLAICQHRLETFQNGPYASHENATALSSINNAIRSLQQRTLRRIARGVEGTMQA